jgi:hypothetical protein
MVNIIIFEVVGLGSLMGWVAVNFWVVNHSIVNLQGNCND